MTFDLNHIAVFLACFIAGGLVGWRLEQKLIHRLFSRER